MQVHGSEDGLCFFEELLTQAKSKPPLPSLMKFSIFPPAAIKLDDLIRFHFHRCDNKTGQ